MHPSLVTMDGFTRRPISRRAFLSASAAGSALLLSGAVGSLARVLAQGEGDEDAPWFDATIAQLRQPMQSGQLSSAELTQA